MKYTDPMKQPTKAEVTEALVTIEAFLQNLLSQRSNWAASAAIRLLKQLKKTIAPLITEDQ